MLTTPQDTFICPHCTTQNAEEAVLCHFCGEPLPQKVSLARPADDDPLGTKDPVLEGVRGLHRGILRWLKRDEAALGLTGVSILGCGSLLFVAILFAPLLLFLIIYVVLYILSPW